MPFQGRQSADDLAPLAFRLAAADFIADMRVCPILPADGDVNQDGSRPPADALRAFQHFLGGC